MVRRDGRILGWANTLVSFTANVQGWTITHALFEYSNKLEMIEIFTPRKDNNGAVTGLNVETIFYDTDAFVAPLRSTMTWNRTQKTGQRQSSPHVRGVPEQYSQREWQTPGTKTTNTDPRL